MIARDDGAFVLWSRAGKALGRHRTRRQAEAQERAIRLAQARRAGHDVPPPGSPPRIAAAGRGRRSSAAQIEREIALLDQATRRSRGVG